MMTYTIAHARLANNFWREFVNQLLVGVGCEMRSKTQSLDRECPLFTTRHAHHSALWCIEGFSLPKLCVACATERLEAKDELQVHVKKVLSEFQALLSVSSNSGGCRLSTVLSRERRVLEHLCGLLFGMFYFDHSEPNCTRANHSSTGLLLSKDVSISQLSLGGKITETNKASF